MEEFETSHAVDGYGLGRLFFGSFVHFTKLRAELQCGFPDGVPDVAFPKVWWSGGGVAGELSVGGMGGDGGGFGGSSGGMVCRAGRVCAIKRGTIKLIAAAGEVGGAFDGCLLDLAGGESTRGVDKHGLVEVVAWSAVCRGHRDRASATTLVAPGRSEIVRR